MTRNAYTDSPPFTLPLPLADLTMAAQSSAIAEIRSYVDFKTEDLMDEIGFGWSAQSAGEPKCAELHHLMAVSCASKLPLPVRRTNASKTLLLDARAAMSLRFIRLIAKARLEDCTCDVASEFAVDNKVIDAALEEHVSPLAQKYMYGELMGETTLRAVGMGTALVPQLYTLDVLALGLPESIVGEAARRRQARAAAP